MSFIRPKTLEWMHVSRDAVLLSDIDAFDYL